MSDDQDGCEWVFLLVLAYPGNPGQTAVKWLCVCVTYNVSKTTVVNVDKITA